MTNLTQIETEQSFEESTRLTNRDLKWVSWWGCYYVISKTSGMEREDLPRVQGNIIYFADSNGFRTSMHFESNDEALFEATRIINNK